MVDKIREIYDNMTLKAIKEAKHFVLYLKREGLELMANADKSFKEFLESYKNGLPRVSLDEHYQISGLEREPIFKKL